MGNAAGEFPRANVFFVLGRIATIDTTTAVAVIYCALIAPSAVTALSRLACLPPEQHVLVYTMYKYTAPPTLGWLFPPLLLRYNV